MDITNVLFVSSSILYKKIVKIALAELVPQATVFTEGKESVALTLLKDTPFDLVIIDSATEDLNIFNILEALEYSYPELKPVLLCDEKATEPGEFSRRIKEYDLIIKPIDEGYTENFKTVKRGLRLAILKLIRKHGSNTETENKVLAKEDGKKPKGGNNYDLLLIAASTGGPTALEKVLTGLTIPPNIPILIVQHMPAGFTKNFASNLNNKQLSVTVSEAVAGDILRSGHVYIAPGGWHMRLNSKNIIILDDGEYVNGVKPSADVLFASVAKHYKGKKIMAVILTGMGSDGKEGVRLLKEECNCYCIAQNEESCTVYGMPRAVVEANLCDKTVHLNNIASKIMRSISYISESKEVD